MKKIIWYHPYFKNKYWNHFIQELHKNIDEVGIICISKRNIEIILFKKFTKTLMKKISWYHPYFKNKYWNHFIQELHKNIDEQNKLVSSVFQKEILKSFYSRSSQELSSQELMKKISWYHLSCLYFKQKFWNCWSRNPPVLKSERTILKF